jgi:hypothetical protein
MKGYRSILERVHECGILNLTLSTVTLSNEKLEDLKRAELILKGTKGALMEFNSRNRSSKVVYLTFQSPFVSKISDVFKGIFRVN